MPAGEEYAVRIQPYDGRLGNTLTNIFNKRDAIQAAKQKDAELKAKTALEAAEAKKKEDAQLEDYYDQIGDPSKLHTGVPGQDKYIDDAVAAIVEHSVAMRNSGYGKADMQSMNRPAFAELSKYSNAVKTGKEFIDSDLKTVGESGSIDMEKLRRAMHRESFETWDEKTKSYKPKRADEIKAVSAYDVLRANPERFVKVGEDGQVVHADLDNYMGKQPLSNTRVESFADYDIKGKKTEKYKRKFSADYMLGQEIFFEKDEHGNDSPNVRFKFETQADLSDKDRKPINVIPDETYNQYFSDEKQKQTLLVETRKRFPNIKIDPKTAEGQQKMKEVGLDLLNKKAVKTKVTELFDHSVAATPGITNIIKTPEEKDADKEYKQGKSSAISSYMEFETGQGQPIADSDYDPDTGLAKVSGMFSGGELKAPKGQAVGGGGAGQVYEGVYMDRNKNMFVKDTENSLPRRIKPHQRKKFLRSIAEANGMPGKVFDKIYKEFYPNADEVSDTKGAKKANDAAISSFHTSGDVQQLKRFNNELFGLNLAEDGEKEDIKKVQVTGFGKRGDQYLVWYNIDNKPVEKELSKEQIEKILTRHYDN